MGHLGDAPPPMNLKTEMEPRMDADKHGFPVSYSKRKPHSKDEFDDWHNSLFISVHPWFYFPFWDETLVRRP